MYVCMYVCRFFIIQRRIKTDLQIIALLKFRLKDECNNTHLTTGSECSLKGYLRHKTMPIIFTIGGVTLNTGS